MVIFVCVQCVVLVIVVVSCAPLFYFYEQKISCASIGKGALRVPMMLIASSS